MRRLNSVSSVAAAEFTCVGGLRIERALSANSTLALCFSFMIVPYTNFSYSVLLTICNFRNFARDPIFHYFQHGYFLCF